jgi:hypothetical protein
MEGSIVCHDLNLKCDHNIEVSVTPAELLNKIIFLETNDLVQMPTQFCCLRNRQQIAGGLCNRIADETSYRTKISKCIFSKLSKQDYMVWRSTAHRPLTMVVQQEYKNHQ